jgi:hypothetical protein
MQSGLARLYPAAPKRSLWLFHNETGCKDSSGIPHDLQGLHRRSGALCKDRRPVLRAPLRLCKGNPTASMPGCVALFGRFPDLRRPRCEAHRFLRQV